MTTTQKILLAAFAAVLLLLGVQTCRLERRDRKDSDARIAPKQARVDSAQAKVETVTVRLAEAETVVVRELGRVRIDTLILRPQTPAETVKVVDSWPLLVAAHDSLQRACTRYVESCQAYRTASEARDTAYRALVQTLRVELGKARPKWYKRVSCGPGYGALATRDGEVRHGVTLSCGLALWPRPRERRRRGQTLR